MGKNNRPKVKDATLSLRLPATLRDRVAKIAAAEQRSMSQQIVKVLLDFTTSYKGGK